MIFGADLLPGAAAGVPASVKAVSSPVSTASAVTGFEFFVPGDCVPWARAGGGKTGHRFTPVKQRDYMAALKLFCQRAMHGAQPLDGPVDLKVEARYPWPKSMTRKKRELPGAYWRTGRPDFDNLAKIVGDALNNIAWLDDAQIAFASVSKVYSDIPGLKVGVEAL
jgi:Holliday junction resolvase RusA-like endonuclease